MQSNAKKVFYYHADASSLGGFIEEPFEGVIPSAASISLPAVGGYATNRTEAGRANKAAATGRPD